MNVETIIIPPHIAKAKLDEYRSAVAKQRSEEDDDLRRLYKAVLGGAKVVNILEAFKSAGLNGVGQPKLAIARADAKLINFMPHVHLSGSFEHVAFTTDSWFQERNVRRYVALPRGAFGSALTARMAHCAVPHIPPSVRPTAKLENYHILFEVERWDTYPTDPFLLQRIAGYLYIVKAEWDLTPLEAAILGAR